MVALELGLKIKWKGKGLNEKGYNEKDQVIIECKKTYFRPSEVDSLIGNYSKAKKLLNWRPFYNIKMLIKEMIDYEYKK